jgi:threonylcarbamoyladenosine tRNA methylthiotransferase MtaB
MKVYFDTIGCRLNQSEIEKMAGQFRSAGHEVVSRAEEAELVVVNTCAVTAEAASDSRQKIRQAARSTKGQIIATGCWATVDRGAAARLEKVSQVVHNQEKEYLVSNLLGISPEQFSLKSLVRESLPGIHQRTRAFIKVQDGCDNFCTYCLTRIARGPSRSFTIKDIMLDVQAAESGGVKEIVLSGVHLGSWGKEWEKSDRLSHLIEEILIHSNIPRIRLSSLEPWDIEPGFFKLWRDSRLCRHLHLPLQSGSVKTLLRMARNTTPALYFDLVQNARENIPGVALTTDIMVGFPGESDQDFNESFEFVRKIGFSGGHVFHFSPRPGTAAARFPNSVSPQEQKRRSAAMRSLLFESTRCYYQQQIGKTTAVLWERAEFVSPGEWKLEGLSDNYLRVSATAQDNLWNQISVVQIEKGDGDGLAGKILD